MSILVRAIFITLLITLPIQGRAAADQQPIRPGEAFPEILLTTPQAARDRAYLQVPANRFTPSQVNADLLLIELINVHCPHCQQQAPAYNELYRMIEENPETRGRIKLLGLAVGNLDKEVKIFQQAYKVPFPILADPSFETLRAVGGRTTPLSIYVRQDRPGQPGIVTGVHHGVNNNRQLYQNLIQMASIDPQELKQQVQATAKTQAQIKPILSSQELEYQVRTALTRFGQIDAFAKLPLLSGRQVYAATISQNGKKERLFAEVTSRSSVCDICHDVHFIYLFDRTSRIIAFEPLQLTKYGNVDWNEREVETMRKRVVGKYLSIPQPFDPEVDAISSATMTSAIIFDSLAQGEELLSELRSQGLL